MTDQDLDRSYTALCLALAAVGQERAPLFLSMVCLSLMARCERAEDVLPLIARVQAQCAAEAGGAPADRLPGHAGAVQARGDGSPA